MAKTAVRTEYFPEDIVRDAVNGCCHDFAFAVHRRTGWPIACLWKDAIIDEYTLVRDPEPVHVFCVTPDGRAIDAEGLTDLAGLPGVYCEFEKDLPRYRVQRHGTEADWVKDIEEEHHASRLDPRDHRIAAAERVIAGSERFVALLDELMAERNPVP